MARKINNKKYKDDFSVNRADHREASNDKSTVIRMDSFTSNFKQKQKSVTLRPRNTKQEELIDHLNDDNKKIVFAIGPAGTGKTLLATQKAVKSLLEKKVDKIVITRPAVSVDEDIGLLPGDIFQKMAPWTRPFFDVVAEYYNSNEVEYMLQEGIIEIAPLSFMRGRTFKNAIVVLDESQNITVEQMKMCLTRLGDGARMFVTGDLNQSDLKGPNGLADFFNKIKVETPDNIARVFFEKIHIERSEIVATVLNLYGDE